MLDRSVLTILLQPIKREFGLGDGQLGFLSGLAFAIPYGLAAMPMGMLADRVPRRAVLALLVFAWSALTFISGLVPGFMLLCLARVGIGLAEAGQPPFVMSLVGDIVPQGRRATAISWIYLGVPAGALVAFLVAGSLAAEYGWRPTIMSAGAPGLILAVVILLFLREPPRGEGGGAALVPTGEASFGDYLRMLRRNAPLKHVFAAAGLASIVASAMSVWLPSLLLRTFQYDIGTVSRALAVSVGFFGIVGAIVGGALSDRIGRGVPSRTAYVTAVMIALLVPISFLTFSGISFGWSVFGNGLFNLLVPGYLAGLHALVLSQTSSNSRGFMIGLMGVMLTLVGYGVGSQLIGVASDLLARAGVANSLKVALLLSATATLWSAAHAWRAAVLLRRAETV
jgi:predicted MFS family arabinose efflux permease